MLKHSTKKFRENNVSLKVVQKATRNQNKYALTLIYTIRLVKNNVIDCYAIVIDYYESTF